MKPGPDRLAPHARPYADALSAVFPDLGGTVTDAREARRILAAAPGGDRPPSGAVPTRDRTVPGPAGAPPLPVRVYRPAGAVGPRPTVVFFHGGGYVLCGLDTHDGTCRALCRESGAVVVSVGYRLAPEARYPAAAEDAYAALQWAAAHVADLGDDPAALIVAGDSAGGGLAAGTALRARDRGGPPLALQLLIYPMLDPAADSPSYAANATGYYLTAAHLRWFWDCYLGPDADRTDPYVCPARAEPAGLPPAHVITAGCDPLCDEGVGYATRLRSAGVRVTEGHHPGMFHGFMALPHALEEAREALASLAESVARTSRHRKNVREQGVSTE